MRQVFLVAAALLCASPAASAADSHDIFGECVRCHSPSGWKEIKSSVKGGLDHAKTGFALVGQHAALSCTDCHQPQRDLQKPWPGACVTCHRDTVHKGSMGQDCARCHTPKSWKVPAGLRVHQATRFPLTGAHLAAECSGCHRKAEQSQFQDAPVACAACHLAASRRAGIVPDHAGLGFSTECNLCHRTSAWRPANFQHALFFPLRASHAGLSCTDCHTSARGGGADRACASCHLDAFQQTQHPPHQAAGFSTECERCHVETRWEEVRSDWHEPFFPIRRGNHAGIDCSGCHPGGTFQTFQCITCHPSNEVAPKHRGVRNFTFSDQACFQCHPRGKE